MTISAEGARRNAGAMVVAFGCNLGSPGESNSSPFYLNGQTQSDSLGRSMPSSWA